LTLPKKKNRKNERKDRRKRNNDQPLELNILKCDQPKHPKIPKETPQSKPRSNNIN
jgi:hypothetical protein